MTRFYAVVLLFASLLFHQCTMNHRPATLDLKTHWDTARPLENPDKGWYHHFFDNGIDKYLLSDAGMLEKIPGMDHLYLRLAWAYLEPEEGQFNWTAIDTIISRYAPLGYGVSFRISSKETGSKPGSVPEVVHGIRYATPSWVQKSGARGISHPEYGSASWTPDWDDPVYLEKLSNFHKAFASRYDDKPYMRYVDVGSIGEWGEGHTHFSTRIPPAVEEVKANIDIFVQHYKHTQLVVTDDLLYWNKSEKEGQELLAYALDKGITLRDDSPMVKYYIENNMETWTVSHPHFFSAVYPTKPTIFELEHYHTVKKNGFWLGQNGKDIIPVLNVSGADIFRNALDLIHPTYIGFHGYVKDWLQDNPQLSSELLNRCGYWFFPEQIQYTVNGFKIRIKIKWLNRGTAPAYHPYGIRFKFISDQTEPVIVTIDDSGNETWLPDKSIESEYALRPNLSANSSYALLFQLFDKKSGRLVDIGLNKGLQDEAGYFYAGRIEID